MADINEQWLRNGDCSLCRRRNYCKKPCKAHKTRSDQLLRSVVFEAMADTITGNSSNRMKPALNRYFKYVTKEPEETDITEIE